MSDVPVSVPVGTVASPCTDVCRIDPRTDWCAGCLRTRDEARDWKKMTDHRRHQILNDRTRRQAKIRRETAE